MAERTATVDLGGIGVSRHHVAALLEIDVTRARCGLRMAARNGRSTVSFLAWLVKNVATSLAQNPSPTGTTVSIMVEREVEGHRITLPLVIPDAAARAVEEIEARIVIARREPVPAADLLFGRRQSLARRVYEVLPLALRRGVLARALRNPSRTAAAAGSVVVTSVGMGGRVRGWFIPRSMHPVCIGIGAVTAKAVVMNGRIESRQVLHLSLVADEQLLEGPPASRWISGLVRAIENGAELSIN